MSDLPLFFFYRFPKNSGFAQIFPCRCPKNPDFAQIFQTWGPIASMPPGRYGYVINLNDLNSKVQNLEKLLRASYFKLLL